MPKIRSKESTRDSNRVVLFLKDKSAPKGAPIARQAYTSRAEAEKAFKELNAKVAKGGAKILNCFVAGKWHYDVVEMESSDILPYGADDTIVNYTE